MKPNYLVMEYKGSNRSIELERYEDEQLALGYIHNQLKQPYLGKQEFYILRIYVEDKNEDYLSYD